ncbi:MAG: 2-succinyl-5-enolpyruvyl-6-hydroxy-3-cyclohexene-1-carboxylic-acid synthase [Syntrophomonadaceae bacterium]|nr:2-succinyl-5-enolpyruvyl-6-hydroxy-3-cyclohexene-1-carboxylic-acid synthase [Syntrophomonadaceae bacterium]
MISNDVITAYVAAFVDELARAGICDVIVSPGSRSAPMAILMAEHSQIKVWTQIDERSAGFFALGMAKAKREPVALLCTSGTAAANYYPAVIEACLSRIPLLVLTADRPHELRDVGAPQSIDQIGLYGKYAKWFVDVAIPDDNETMLHYIRTVAGRAVGTAIAGPAGVVHLNFPFREPLVPKLSLPNLWTGGRRKISPSYVKVQAGDRQLDLNQLQWFVDTLKGVQKGIIVCGPLDDPQFAQEVTHLAARLQYPVLADPLSQVRSGSHPKEWIIDSYDSFLRNENVKKDLEPEIIIRFGAMPTSKAFLLYVQAHPNARQIVIDKDSGWQEPTLMASDMFYSDPVKFCCRLSQAVDKPKPLAKWGAKWKKLNEISRSHMQKEGIRNNLFEGQVIIELQKLLPDGASLYVGNSMPVRDLDAFFAVTHKNIRVLGNRGANGIDGLVSSALGASVACFPLVLVIGDVSFYHDLNGLLAAKLHGLNITIVVLNNNGGGIFSFLPQAKHKKHFEMLFGTPTGLNFEQAVNMYGGFFARVSNWQEFREMVACRVAGKGLSVIEVPTEREENAELHRRLWQSLSENISQSLDIGI